jgi:hypothetical protein
MGELNPRIWGSCAELWRLRWRMGQGLEAPAVLSSGRNSARQRLHFATVPEEKPVVSR